MFEIYTTKSFDSKARTYKKKSLENKKRLKKFLYLIRSNPFYPSLRTHKVESRGFGKKFSSRLGGDNRVIWDYYKGNLRVLILMNIGGHEGQGKVY